VGFSRIYGNCAAIPARHSRRANGDFRLSKEKGILYFIFIFIFYFDFTAAPNPNNYAAPTTSTDTFSQLRAPFILHFILWLAPVYSQDRTGQSTFDNSQ
jgi:hypothetical protein